MQPIPTDNPERQVDQWLATGPLAGETLHLRFPFAQYYLEGAPVIELLALFQAEGEDICFTVGPIADAQLTGEVGAFSLKRFCRQQQWPLLVMSSPLKLQPVAIPKPWGREIWYTGIEQRGLSQVTDGEAAVPLPWVLAALPRRLTAGMERQVNLLKILDPLPEEVFGDLYFELHEEKREVYVVTHVDSRAWPDGVGGIRFGFDDHLLADYDSEETFKADYLAAVRAYERVRRDIDARLDQFRLAEGVDLDAPVSAEQLKCWLSRLPPSLREEEAELRQRMNRFTAILPLRVGDVVKVPLHTPHALQHGVRTVEFQTPVYERRILSFAQKVLTQDHWDTRQAVEMMSLAPPVLPELMVLDENSRYRLEEVVSFDDFRVERLTLAPGAAYSLPDSTSYVLVMSVDSEVRIAGRTLAAEEAVLVSAQRCKTDLVSVSDSGATLLMAWPARGSQQIF